MPASSSAFQIVVLGPQRRADASVPALLETLHLAGVAMRDVFVFVERTGHAWNPRTWCAGHDFPENDRPNVLLADEVSVQEAAKRVTSPWFLVLHDTSIVGTSFGDRIAAVMSRFDSSEKHAVLFGDSSSAEHEAFGVFRASECADAVDPAHITTVGRRSDVQLLGSFKYRDEDTQRMVEYYPHLDVYTFPPAGAGVGVTCDIDAFDVDADHESHDKSAYARFE